MTGRGTPAIEGLSEFNEIGAGGFGVVYSATEAGTGRTVAVKVLKNVDASGRRQFEREQVAMGRMADHEHIVTLLRHGVTDDGEPFLVMEFLAKGSLDDQIKAEGSHTWDHAIDQVIPIADALGYGHERGIIHQDVKPANILVSGRDVVKLTDFGMSAVRQASTLTKVAHTPAYTPPETYAAHHGDDGKVVDHRDERSDLYSLGATLYALGTGTAPFTSVAQTLNNPVPTVGHQALDRFFAKAMAKDPDDRYQTAEEFIDALQRVRAAAAPVTEPDTGDPISPIPVAAASATSSASADRGGRPSARVLGAVAAVLLLAAVGIGVIVFGGDDGGTTVDVVDDTDDQTGDGSDDDTGDAGSEGDDGEAGSDDHDGGDDGDAGIDSSEGEGEGDGDDDDDDTGDSAGGEAGDDTGDGEEANARDDEADPVDVACFVEGRLIATGESMNIELEVSGANRADATYDPGDGQTPTSSTIWRYFAPGVYDVSVDWSATNSADVTEGGTARCGSVTVSGNPAGWSSCPTAARPAAGTNYTVRNVDDEGLAVRAGPGTEAPKIDVMPEGTSSTFDDCFQSGSGSRWWKRSSGGWASANFLRAPGGGSTTPTTPPGPTATPEPTTTTSIQSNGPTGTWTVSYGPGTVLEIVNTLPAEDFGSTVVRTWWFLPDQVEIGNSAGSFPAVPLTSLGSDTWQAVVTASGGGCTNLLTYTFTLAGASSLSGTVNERVTCDDGSRIVGERPMTGSRSS